jgi:hypothetical protein
LSLPAAQAIWRRALPHSVRSAAAPAVARLLEAYVRAVPRPKPPATTAGLPIRVVGLFEASHGIGASARLAVRAFEALGASVETASLAGDTSDWARRPPTASPAVWLFYLNSPELVAALCGCTTQPMDDTEYDRLSIVRVDAAGRATLEVQRYGGSPP